MDKEVRVRIAPSPTGDPHVGTAYIALFNYVFAKKMNGKFIIRIEDTDRSRYNEESEKSILQYLKWLSLDWDEGPDIGGDYGPYKQSEREYKKYADQLLENGRAYRCFCTQERISKLREHQKANSLPTGYDGHCRNLTQEEQTNLIMKNIPFVLRLKVPRSGKSSFKDLLRGEISFDNFRIDDQILLKSDGMPTYHLANVIDDHTMKISHVIRAEEWIPSTPKHKLIYDAFGWEEPIFVHMPLLKNSDSSKISKRKNDLSLAHYYKSGYLKEALNNFLSLLGWSRVGEIFSMEDMIKAFDFKDVSLSSPIFDLNKLNWMNREYIRAKSVDELKELLNIESPFLDKAIDVFRDCYTINEMRDSLIKFLAVPQFNEKDVDKSSLEVANILLDVLRSESKDILGDMKKKDIAPKVLFPALRFILIGERKGIELVKILNVFDKDELIKRVENFVSSV